MEWVSIAEKLWKDYKGNDPRFRSGKTSLPFRQRVSFSVGHVFFDLCHIVWCTYLLLYLTKVAGLSPEYTGYLFVVVQGADALLTPFIEIGIDRVFPTVNPNYGRKKLWHLFGTVLVFLSWPMLFSPCLVCDDGSAQSSKLAYYAVVAIVLLLGWSVARTSHLALMPTIVQRHEEVTELNTLRSTISFVCSIIVFAIMWIILGQSTGKGITPALEDNFTTLSLIVVGFGFVFSFIFHCGTVEPSVNQRQAHEGTSGDIKAVSQKASSRDLHVLRRYIESSTDCASQQAEFGSSTDTRCLSDQYVGATRSWRQWLNDADFVKVAVVYTCTRVVSNVLQFYFVFYITDSLHFKKEAIAYFPLILLVIEVLANALFLNIRKKLGNKWTFCAVAVVVLQSCIWFHLQSRYGKDFVFLSAIMMGGSSSMMLATALSMVTDLANKDRGSSGFVYSAMGILDKGSVGIIVLIIQKNYPICLNGVVCADYARLVFTLTPAIFTGIAVLTVIVFFNATTIISCTSLANRNEQCSQTDFDSPASTVQAVDSIYTINEENDELSQDKYEMTEKSALKGKAISRCYSAPIVSLIHGNNIPAVSRALRDQHPSTSLQCKTVDGVPLAVEKVIVFSCDSFAAGNLTSDGCCLHEVGEEESVDDLPQKQSMKEQIYKRISLLRSTEL